MLEITETTEPDLITEVEELLAKRGKINRYVKSVCCNYAPCENCDQDWCGCECHDPTEEDLLELLRRLVEEVKRLRAVIRNGSPVGKLTAASVAEIKAALRSGASGSYLAEKYGVTDTTISLIKRGRTWRHVE